MAYTASGAAVLAEPDASTATARAGDAALRAVAR